MRIAFCHHLSLSYYGGGEKWLIQLSNELVKRGHEVSIYALPFLLDGKPKVNPKDFLPEIPYFEGIRHYVNADVTYLTYNPLSWINFKTSHPRIAGIHSHAYWFSPHPSYGLLPNLANVTNRFTSYFELRGYDAVHTVTNVFPINHPKVYYIPNFVDSERFKPCEEKEDVFTVAFASRNVWQKGWDIFRNVKERLDNDINVKISYGKVSEENMPSFLSSAHVTLIPSRVDTFGLSIVESMMCETPVITTPSLVHIGLKLPCRYAKEPSSFLKEVRAVKMLYSEFNDTYERFIKECRERALVYDKKKIVDRLEKMFEAVAK